MRPPTRDVAEALGADAAHLRHFAEHHPDPTAPVVLGAFDADPDHADLVAEWLEALEARTDRRRNAATDGGES